MVYGRYIIVRVLRTETIITEVQMRMEICLSITHTSCYELLRSHSKTWSYVNESSPVMKSVSGELYTYGLDCIAQLIPWY